MAVGALTSFVDSGYQNYKDCFIDNDKTLGEAIADTVTNTVLGGVFAGMGFEGTGAFKESIKHIKKELKNSLIDNGLTSVTGYGLGKLSALCYTYYSGLDW